MNVSSKILLRILLLLFLFYHPAAAETVKCSECGMKCDTASRFSARIIQDGKTLYFCDIGDFFSYLKEHKISVTSMEVHDYDTGEWIDAHQAFYVHSDKMFKTPMGWGIASFRNKVKASGYGTALDFEGTAKALK